MHGEEWSDFLQAKADEADTIRRLKQDRRAWFDPNAGKQQPAVDLLPPNLSGLCQKGTRT